MLNSTRPTCAPDSAESENWDSSSRTNASIDDCADATDPDLSNTSTSSIFDTHGGVDGGASGGEGGDGGGDGDAGTCGGGGGGGGALGEATSSQRYPPAKWARTASMSPPKKAKSELGEEAIDRIVASAAPPKPTATTDTPAAFTTPACAIAVESSPSTVCTPSVSSSSVRGTPGRAAAPLSTLSPSARKIKLKSAR